MMLGDESYAGATSFFKLKEVITRLTGFEYIIPTHQGRAAENVLFSYLVHEGDIVPGNSHFDTTKGHIEGRRALALDCTIDEAKQTQLEIPFKGNVDPKNWKKHYRNIANDTVRHRHHNQQHCRRPAGFHAEPARSPRHCRQVRQARSL